MPTMLFVDGSSKKRYDRATRTAADYILVISEHELRVRRRISDRYRNRGRIYAALKKLLRDEHGVEPDVWKSVVAAGGEIGLRSRR